MDVEIELPEIKDITDEERRQLYLRRQIKLFTTQIGKWIAVVIFTIVGLSLSGNILPVRETALAIIAVVMLVAASMVFGVFTFFQNRDIDIRKKTVDFHKALAGKVDALAERNVELENRNRELMEQLSKLKDTADGLAKIINDFIKAYAPVYFEKEKADEFFKRVRNEMED